MNVEAPSWLVAMLEAVSLWDLLIWLGVIVGGVVFIKKRAWRSVVAFARGIVNSAEILAAVQGLPEWQTRIEQKIDGIHHETHKNDGSSVKDAVDRIEVAQARIEEGVGGLHGRMDTVEVDVRALRAADAELRADIEHTIPPKE